MTETTEWLSILVCLGAAASVTWSWQLGFIDQSMYLAVVGVLTLIAALSGGAALAGGALKRLTGGLLG